MEYLNIFNNIITIISFFVNVAFIVPLFIKLYNYFSNKRYIKKVLNFNNETVQISHSTFTFSTGAGHKHDYITYESLESINNVIKLLCAINQKFDLIKCNNSTQNEINVGGFVSNKKVNAYFHKHFNSFKFIANAERKKVYEKYPINHEMIAYSSEKTGFKINEDIFLETNNHSDYAFIIKLTNSDFKDDNNKSVHILFGAGNIGTVKATEYLLTHCKQIYKKYGNKHYFFAVEVNTIDKSLNYSNGIIDLTDIMFLNNQ